MVFSAKTVLLSNSWWQNPGFAFPMLAWCWPSHSCTPTLMMFLICCLYAYLGQFSSIVCLLRPDCHHFGHHESPIAPIYPRFQSSNYMPICSFGQNIVGLYALISQNLPRFCEKNRFHSGLYDFLSSFTNFQRNLSYSPFYHHMNV